MIPAIMRQQTYFLEQEYHICYSLSRVVEVIAIKLLLIIGLTFIGFWDIPVPPINVDGSSLLW